MPFDDSIQPGANAAASLIPPAPSAGAALPPAQGGPSFSDTEMRTLSGGGRPSPYRAPAAKPAQETAQPFDLNALRKEIGEDLSSLGTREALDEAISGLGDLSAPAEEEPPAPAPAQPDAQTQDAPQTVDAARIEANRKRISQASVSSLKRFLSGGRPTGRRISDDEAFGAEGAVIIGSPDSMPGPSLPW